MRAGTLDSSELPPPGTSIGGCRIERLLGKGGFGAVFEAYQERFDRQVAVKVILPSATASIPDLAQRFLREIDLVKRLEHSNVARLYDFGETESGILWMAMELVRGPELSDVLSETGALHPERAKHIILQALSALAEAHQHEIVHRDLKPSNIMLTTQGADTDVVKLLDFGIGKAFGESEDRDIQDITKEKGESYGTPRYMAPECLFGENVGPHSDVYGVGLILFEMLVGRPAVVGANEYEILAQQISRPVQMPDWLARSQVGPIVQRATAKDWQVRPSDALALHREIKQIDFSSLLDAPGRFSGSHHVVDAGVTSRTDRKEQTQRGVGSGATNDTANGLEPALPRPPSIPERDESAGDPVDATQPGVSDLELVKPTQLEWDVDEIQSAARASRRNLWILIAIGASVFALVLLGLMLLTEDTDEAEKAVTAEASVEADAAQTGDDGADGDNAPSEAVSESAGAGAEHDEGSSDATALSGGASIDEATPSQDAVPAADAATDEQTESPESDEVVWEIRTEPDGAAVHRGDELLCAPTPCEFRVSRADTPLELSITKENHARTTRSITPSRDDTLDVTLEKDVKGERDRPAETTRSKSRDDSGRERGAGWGEIDVDVDL